MRSKSEVVGKATQVKVAMLKRVQQIQQLSSNIGLAKAGMAPDIKQDRLETMEVQVKSLSLKQERDGMVLASLRWALGITDDVDATNLELDL